MSDSADSPQPTVEQTLAFTHRSVIPLYKYHRHILFWCVILVAISIIISVFLVAIGVYHQIHTDGGTAVASALLRFSQTVVERILSWPVCVAIGLFLLQEDIKGLLRNLHEIDPAKGIVKFAQRWKQPEHPQNDTTASSMVNALSPVDSAAPSPQPVVTASSQSLLHIDDPDVKTQKLEQDIRDLQDEIYMEKCYRSIYGSQIIAMKRLAASAMLGRQHLEPIFNDAFRTYPHIYEGASFTQWIAFLLNWKLVTQIGDFYMIAEQGKDFLAWMARNGIPEQKLY